MDPVLLRYIHLETGIFLVFLMMLALTQLSRAQEPASFIRNSRGHAIGLSLFFGILATLFVGALSNVSPLLGLELAAGITLALIHPVNALCLFVHMLFLRPWDILAGNAVLAILPRLLAGICLVSWLIHPWKRGVPNAQNTRALRFLLAFGGWLFLSTLMTPDVSIAQASWFDTFFKALVVFVMCSYFIDNARSVSEFKYTILLSVFTIAILGLYQLLVLPPGQTSQNRMQAVSMLDPNDLAAVSVIVVPLALAPVFRKTSGIIQRFVGLLFFVMALITIWYSQSRGALLALTSQFVLFQFVKTYRRNRVVAIVMIAIMAAGYFMVLGSLRRTSDDLYASKESRLEYWKAAARMTVRNPIFGVGYSQFPDRYESYSSYLKYEWGRRTAHSSWLLAFAESGLLGGILFIGFFITVLQAAWRNRRERPDQFYALGGYAVAMTFLSHTYLLFPYLLYGLILATDSVKERDALRAENA